MGVHTGDSITVAPQMTLSDREYQAMRDDALTVLRAVGVETGGANVQFAVDPASGRRVVIEMNPRVSRSSALASKATGFPIAKVAALLAVGFTLDEIRNEVTGKTAAAFEPTIDYVVCKVPRFAFEKFPGADPVLTTRMKSVGEVIAIGRTLPEALQKAWRSLEAGRDGLWSTLPPGPGPELARLAVPTEHRLELVAQALQAGRAVDEVAAASSIDPWFVDGVARIVEVGAEVEAAGGIDMLGRELLWRAKRHGFSDRQLAAAVGATEGEVRTRRRALGVEPVYRSVDTCAGEF
jgi:carbamoyl-phosphate synthase large subunit